MNGSARISRAFALGTVGLQIAYPLASDARRRTLSIVTVGTFAAASTADAVRIGGPRAGLALLACGAGIGGLAEIVGIHTGRPFGRYRYAGSLGPQPFGVPIVVPLAWTMAAWPAWRVAGLVASPTRPARRMVRWVTAAWALASWDLFLDPQMVDAGHWEWLQPTPALPGVPGIPITNFVGWLGVSLAVTGALELTLGARPTQETKIGSAVGVLAGWTWVGGIIANAAFFRRPGVALAGGLAMGAVALPALRTAMSRRRG